MKVLFRPVSSVMVLIASLPLSAKVEFGNIHYNTYENRNELSKVGYHTTRSPGSYCADGKKHADWRANAQIIWGKLPPGLEMDPAGTIEGAPEGPGVWKVRIRFSDVTCMGKSFSDQVVPVEFIIEAAQ